VHLWLFIPDSTIIKFGSDANLMEDEVLMALLCIFFYFSSEKSFAPFAVTKAIRNVAKPTEKKKPLIIPLQLNYSPYYYQFYL